MKKLSVYFGIHLWLIFLCFPAAAQDFQTIQDGIEHAKYTRRIKSADGEPENVVFNLLRLDLTKVRLDVVHALDAAIGLEKTSSIAARHGAFAAINAGFFRIDKSIFEGDDTGVLQIDGRLLSEPFANRVALLINNDKKETRVGFEKIDVSLNLHVSRLTWKINGINRERKTDELILYTPEFQLTTLTDNGGLEISVEDGKITRISEEKGSNRIPANGYVLSASGKIKEDLIKFVKIGAKAMVPFPLDFLSSTEDLVGGVPQLIKNGKVEITWEQEKSSKSFVETHHPRTAVAKLKDGKFLMVAVDGRSEASGGISLPDLAAVLLELGATDAMNLDGGGSTTMFLQGKIVNKPSDKQGERKVSDAILVTPRRKN